MKIVAACVSIQPKQFTGKLEFVNRVNPVPAPPRKTIARVAYVANERNLVVKDILQKFPDTTHILMVDSWYLDNPENNGRWDSFIDSYDDPSIILGAATFVIHKSPYLLSPAQKYFCEFSITPEAIDVTQKTEGKHGRIRVNTVGGVYIFPIEAWTKNGYGGREDYFWPEHNQLCKDFKCYLDFDYEFYKPPKTYSLYKKLRMTGGAILHGL